MNVKSMVIESDLKISIRNTVIGGSNLLICVPLMARGKTELLKEAQTALQHKPDLLEWRVDAFNSPIDSDTCLDALTALRDIIGDLPLIFTHRSHGEGGYAEVPADKRESVIAAAIRSGYVDLIDIELSNDELFIRNISKATKDSGLQLILSYHDFETTPDSDVIVETLFNARSQGADIAKVAVMPQEFGDVLTLMGAALQARKNGLKIPMIAISMGTVGGLTRVAGKRFGSDITFASSQSVSAPGQIPIEKLRQTLALLECH